MLDRKVAFVSCLYMGSWRSSLGGVDNLCCDEDLDTIKTSFVL